ncbi:kinase-like domain-containing protein [Mycena galericulata]|nr:kinase-like domain-containing protein [Mycena galericulata]
MDNTFRERKVLKSTEIRIIDFGNGNEATEKCKGIAGTAGYQAPEVIMEWNWTNTIDHFSIGCIIAEMLTYEQLIPIFAGTREETLVFMDKILGPFPETMRMEIDDDYPPSKYGTFDGWILSGRATLFMDNAKTLQELIEDRDARNFVARLTHLNPSKRGTLRYLERSRFITTYEL